MADTVADVLERAFQIDGWQRMETAPKNRSFLAAIHHGQCGYLVVCAKRTGPAVHDVAEGSCVGWRPGHVHQAFWRELPVLPAVIARERVA